ncbi:tetratricopeptide repeat protein [Shinella sp. G-2]|uniref:tetratricopeptide repeat protein n=1 Tax=Shinella sp. G-2 TaxID=3133141 RepID=UPI003D076606
MKSTEQRPDADALSFLKMQSLRLWSILLRFAQEQRLQLTRRMRVFSANGREFALTAEEAHARQVAGELSAALDLWEDVRARWPQDAAAYVGAASCARQLGQIDRAETITAEGLSRFPAERNLISEAAQNLQARGDWTGSVAMWERIVDRNDAQPVWLHIYGHALLICGEYDRLEAALKRFRALYPKKSSFISLEAMLASEREDWETAVRLWQGFREAFPNEPVGWEHYGRAHQELEYARMAECGDDHSVAPMEQVKVDILDDEEARQLLIGFEGLGSDCEFGLAQRRFGAEPLSLLRFNAVTFGGLMTGLATRFDGMGLQENTEMITLANGEYFVRDRRWGLGMHTFKFVGQIDGDLLFRKFCERVVFLRDKLLSDLGEGRKVFVFFAPGLALSDVKMLHAALREVGPVKLLHVTTADSALAQGLAAEGGGIDVVAPDLYIGYLSRTGRTATGAWDIAFDDWLTVCRKVRTAVDGG